MTTMIIHGDNLVALKALLPTCAGKVKCIYINPLSEDQNYIVVYAKKSTFWKVALLPRPEEQDKIYKNPDNDSRGLWRPNNLAACNVYSKGTSSIRCLSGCIIAGPPQGSYWRI